MFFYQIKSFLIHSSEMKINIIEFIEENFETENIIMKLIENANLTSNTLVFNKCNFNNFAKCLTLMLLHIKKNFINIKTIKFIKCLPEDEIESVSNFSDPDINLLFSEINEKVITIPNKTSFFFTVKKPNFNGLSLNLLDLSLYKNNTVNFMNLFTSQVNIISNGAKIYLMDFLNKNKIRVPEALPSYILKINSISYFQDFFSKFIEMIEKNKIICYEIIIYNNEKELQQFVKSNLKPLEVLEKKNANIDKKLKDLEYSLTLSSLNGLFRNLSSIFTSPIVHYIYLHCQNKYKSEIQSILFSYTNNTLNPKQFVKIKDKTYIITTINNRPVLIYNIREVSASTILKKIILLKEKNIYTLYEKYGLNYVIYKMIYEHKIEKNKTIETVINNFIQFILITRG